MRDYKKTLYASYIGSFTQAVVNNFVPLLFLTFHDQFDISIGKISFLITLNFGTQMLVDFFGAKYAERIGYRRAIVAAHIFSALGLMSLGILPYIMDPFAGLAAAVAIYAVGGGLIEVLVSPIVEALPGDAKTAAMSLLHSFNCWGQVCVIMLSSAFFFIFGLQNWRYLALFWAAIPTVNAFFFSQVPINTLEEGLEETFRIKKLFSLKLFWIFFFLMLCSGAAEQAMAQWVSLFVESELRVSKIFGDLVGPCVFAILMGVSRLYFGRRGERIDLRKYIFICGALCGIGFLTAALSPFALLSLVGCGVCGLSVGILWPGVLSLASRLMPGGATAMFGLLALAGDVGCFAGPDLVGLVSSLTGGISDTGEIRIGLLCAAAFSLLIMLGSHILKKSLKTK